jgi:hypothetical protein
MAEKDDSPKKTKVDVPDTPSAQALAEVGEPPANSTEEELVAHAEKYAAAKRKHRWG